MEKNLYQCNFCDKLFGKINNFKIHRTIHWRKNLHWRKTLHIRYICDKSFAVSFSWTIHKLMHTGERLYACDICAKSFAASISLTTHLRTHSGEKPYECDICDKSFSASNSLWNIDAHTLVKNRTSTIYATSRSLYVAVGRYTIIECTMQTISVQCMRRVVLCK